MISTTESWNSSVSSMVFDNLFSTPIYSILQNEYDDLSFSQDDLNKDESQIDLGQSKGLSSNGKSGKTSLLNLICGVCGAPAYGYNFDQITCESCKAFFRRNALRDLSHFKCQHNGSCVINIQSRRQCIYCRLKKCFEIQMRKEWIRTDEERILRQVQKYAKEQKKLNKLPANQQSRVLLPIVSRKKKRLITEPIISEIAFNSICRISSLGCNQDLTNDDRILLSNITNAYQIGAAQADCSYIKKYSVSVSLSQFINDESVMHSSLIYFYKSIPEFKEIDVDDQLLLIKWNLLNIVHLHRIIIQNFQDWQKIGEHMSTWINPEFHYQMSRTRRYFYRFMKFPLLLKLTLIVFIFSINLSVPQGSAQFDEFKNKSRIFQCQNYYTTILWRYLNHLFDEREAVQAMELIVTQILRYQLSMTTIEEHVRQLPQDILHPLMKSIFRLT